MNQATFYSQAESPDYSERILDWALAHPDYVEAISEQVFLLELEAEGEMFFCIPDCPIAAQERYGLAHDYYYQRALEEIIADPPGEAWA